MTLGDIPLLQFSQSRDNDLLDREPSHFDYGIAIKTAANKLRMSITLCFRQSHHLR